MATTGHIGLAGSPHRHAARQHHHGSAALRITSRAFGVFYLAMAWGINVFVTLPMARQAMQGFARDSWLPAYQDLLYAAVVPHAVAVTGNGVLDNRRFHLVDARRRLLNGKQHGPLVRVTADFDPDGRGPGTSWRARGRLP